MNGGDLERAKELKLSSLKPLAAQVNSFVPFCVGLYLNLAVVRWWQVRVMAIGTVLDAFVNVLMIVTAEVPGEPWRRLRMQVAKFGLASIKLVVFAARGYEAATLVDDGLLDPEEAAVLEGVPQWHRPVIMWNWILQLCLTALDQNKTPPPRTTMIQKQCIAARDGLATINTYAETQLPFAYVHLVTLFVNAQNLVMASSSGLTVAVALGDKDYALCLMKLLSLMAVVLVYQGLMGISYMILDPLGDDVLDFPVKAFMRYAALSIDSIHMGLRDCVELCAEVSSPPPKASPPVPHSLLEPEVTPDDALVSDQAELLEGLRALSAHVRELQERLPSSYCH